VLHLVIIQRTKSTPQDYPALAGHALNLNFLRNRLNPNFYEFIKIYFGYSNNRAGRRNFRQEQKQQTSPGRKMVNSVKMLRVHRLRIDADDKTAIYTPNM
jgi:hypothetical protein